MNFLAHLRLAPEQPLARVGNLMGDFYRGRVDKHLPWPLQEGIRLHRKIDAYTDAHPIVRRSVARVSPARRRFAGIIVDLAYDHFLCVHWARFYSVSRSSFIREVYMQLHAYRSLMPHEMDQVVRRMTQQDWLNRYDDIAVIARALDRIAARFSRPVSLLGGGEEVYRHYHQLESDFLKFFPELIDYVAASPVRPVYSGDQVDEKVP